MKSLALMALALIASPVSIVAANGPQCRTAAAPPLRTSWGDPDLQGVWSGLDSIGVPFDREPTLGARSVLTEAEFEARQATLRANAAPESNNIEATNFGRGAEGEVLLNRSRQASLVVDPPDGRRPPRTPESDVRQPPPSSFSAGPFNSVVDLGIFDRCIAFTPVSAALRNPGFHISSRPDRIQLPIPEPKPRAGRSPVYHPTRGKFRE